MICTFKTILETPVRNYCQDNQSLHVGEVFAKCTRCTNTFFSFTYFLKMHVCIWKLVHHQLSQKQIMIN